VSMDTLMDGHPILATTRSFSALTKCFTSTQHVHLAILQFFDQVFNIILC
jgi:hypothetical protein